MLPTTAFPVSAMKNLTACLLLHLLIGLSTSPISQGATILELPSFTSPGHPGWQEKRFAGQTIYTPVRLNDHPMLRADSRASASGLFLEQRIDLRRTPVLNWSWQVEAIIPGIDERQKSGDDFAARVYVIAKGGLAFWRTRALSYVWSNSQPVGSIWPNPFTANAVLIAAQSGRQRLGAVIEERHNIREDWQRAFHEDISFIDGIAIMTDSDNSGQTSSALYTTPWFSAD